MDGKLGYGASWSTDNVKASLTRISSSSSVEQAQAQASVEAVVLLHSIRRILMWTAVIIPLLLVAAGIILTVTTSNSGSSSCSYSTYSSRC
ncbi:hypothetical protein [Kutzneria sp. NPDC051319]|uniref:hypothetical protein n=1 Tax=Kutzneria sp. NPDC051319 TaxID=3155047 RepID=UPI003439C064